MCVQSSYSVKNQKENGYIGLCHSKQNKPSSEDRCYLFLLIFGVLDFLHTWHDMSRRERRGGVKRKEMEYEERWRKKEDG